MNRSPSSRLPELWAGPECTVNRVHDAYLDQNELTGHAQRPGDLDLIAGLGVRAVRYPVLWERTAPDGLANADWRWPDERLNRLRELGVRPIAGLVHHGSGPPSTSLVDERFPERLAEYAHAVATRYPWIEDWTPVNEPLTTARFSGLYGHWYPHGGDYATFGRALLTQCRGVVLAMRAIREATPGARLIQTDDLGKTHSTPHLRYQAALENERRWLSWDLLCGRLVPDAPMWSFLRDAGIGEDELGWFLENPCPPDVVGVNHYLSSERFLDERQERYPVEARGGNERDRYADVLAARVLAGGADGPKALLREAWERYGIPVAVTEVHNGCTREEQLRWLDEVWRSAVEVRDEGADVVAVTIWSLFGAVGWDRLVTAPGGRYEPGVFDVSAGTPRPTAIASMVRALGETGTYDHPVLRSRPWWRRDMRLWYEPVGEPPAATDEPDVPPLLVTGATGTLGAAVARACELRGLRHRLLGRSDMDIADPASVRAALDAHQPWAVVNTAGYVRVDDAESDAARCRRENADGPAVLAAECARRGVGLATFSSDLVFDGRKLAPYLEGDAVAPLSVYGRTKAEGERRVLAAHPGALVIRTSAFFGPWDEWNFVTVALRALAGGHPFAAADDVVVSPTYVPDLVDASLDLLIDGEHGVWHLASDGETSWANLARAAAEACDLDPSLVVARPAAAVDGTAARPRYSALASERGRLMPTLADALARYAAATAADPR